MASREIVPQRHGDTRRSESPVRAGQPDAGQSGEIVGLARWLLELFATPIAPRLIFRGTGLGIGRRKLRKSMGRWRLCYCGHSWLFGARMSGRLLRNSRC